ncbi:MAG: fibronectin type III domain-containing protein, partial [Phycisphaerae bacterium]|nr:fibronectin type III domain-containing protein [Phycisphaerae bacterium]
DTTPPTVTTATPSSPVSDIEGATRIFSIDIDQTVDVTWLIDGTSVQMNGSVTSASYTNTSAVPGCWNVSTVANNTNGTVVRTWIWNVAETNETNITGEANFTTTICDANVTGNFSNPLDGWINVTDVGDNLTVSPDVNASTMCAGLGDGDVLVGGVYIDASQSDIEDEMAAGNGSIRIELHYTDAELIALGIADENALDIYKFNTTSSEWELVRIHAYCVANGRDTDANRVWVEVTHLCTFAMVGTTSPVITDVANSTPTTDSVTITWTTDEDSDSLVKYGTTSGVYTDDESDAAMVTSHSIALTGLNAGTTYYFVVNSTDGSDNSNESVEYSFTTAAIPDTTPPTVTGTPPSQVSDIEGASRTFSIDIDQTVNVTWLLDGVVVKDTEKGVTSASYTNTSAAVGTWNVSAVVENANGTDMWTWDWIVTAAGTGTFDTGGGTYPSIRGTHKGNFTPNCDITVNKMYTYPCSGTGGHSEYV